MYQLIPDLPFEEGDSFVVQYKNKKQQTFVCKDIQITPAAREGFFLRMRGVNSKGKVFIARAVWDFDELEWDFCSPPLQPT